MINWDEFAHIHVIRKLREVIGKWFAIDVFFADDRGNLKLIEKGRKHECTNKVVGLLLSRDEGVEALAELARETVNELRKTQEKDL
ncbi:MAG: nitrogen fixation protein NifA, partial [Pseudomonadota bacterium]